MAAKKPQLVIEFNYEKPTPNTSRFKEDEPEDGSRPAIGTVYITKKAIVDSGLKGKRLRFTIEDAD